MNKGKLFLVATPIGNLNEISKRALDVLNMADVIACEDTRNTLKLLSHFDIHTKMISYHNFNEDYKSIEIIELLNEGKNVALVSDAGYPLISDPGYELVNKVIEEGIKIETISGPNAALNALVASGLSSTHFLFYGFLNPKSSQAKKELESLKDFPYTIIFYEAPHRINKTLELAYEILGDRRAVIARELTKIHEEFIRGNLSELVKVGELKGEIVFLVEGNKKEDEVDYEIIKKEIDDLLKKENKIKDIVNEIADKYSIPKNKIKDLIYNHN